ncbi:host cell division inhibitor Icd-like protein [Serratia ureilytica]|uniref:host cell division inhibitor Icd-like protein n=2 Tax=Serratia TaxID=613 RepID=UPI0039EC1C89
MHNHASSQKDAFPLDGIHYCSADGLAQMKKGCTANATLRGHDSNLSFEQNQYVTNLLGNQFSLGRGAQPFGSIPSLRNLSRQESLTHELKFPCPAMVLICSSSESSKRMCFIVLPLRSNAFFSFSPCIGSYQYYNGDTNGNYRFVVNQYHFVNTAKPGSGGTLTGPLTTTDSSDIEAAMQNHITPLSGRNSLTQNKFTWRFLALSRTDSRAKPCRISVEAYTELEARQALAPHFILSLAARLPAQEVSHA